MIFPKNSISVTDMKMIRIMCKFEKVTKMRQSDMDMRNFFSGIMMCAVALAMAGCTPQREKDLVAAFENPPQEAKPVMIWQWMDGWVSREGITHDLEAYAEAGLGGVQNFQVGGPEQTDFAYEKYPVGSPGWKEMMRFAMEECARLGLSFGTHNCPGWSSSAYPDVTPEYSMLEMVWTVTPWRAGQRSAKLPQPTERLGFYRDICVLALPAGADPVPADAVQDVSAAMSGDGTLDWDPQGRSWEIYRFGYTTLNKRDDATSPASGAGLECDKMSREAVRRFFEGYPSMILDLAGDLAGKTLVDFEIDSYEQKSQSWTPAMEAEFASHRGYALRVWLPVLAGRTVESAARSAQFRTDWKATIEDLFAENYYAYMSELVKQTPGMRLLIQPYGDPLDPEKVASQDEDFILCGEFWTNPPTWGGRSIYQVSELAHKLGRREAYAEGFTCWPMNAWEDDPYKLKVVADKVFCVGINRLMLHAAASNPWPWAEPGMTFGKWGTQFTPGSTWWKAGGAKALFRYFAQCQALLQRGEFVENQVEGELLWIHRREGDIDIYFISNQKTDRAVTVDLPFAQGLVLDPGGSEFVVLRGGRRLPVTLNPGGVRSALALQPQQTLEGPWTLSFPEGLGAPSQVTLDSLTDWKDHGDPGVKYFSGTASYRRTFSAERPRGGRAFLDLGEVNVMAEVLVNGRSCGLLWRPPFVADVTDALRDGTNELEIRVTNLWVNRMIGDEFEPDDIVWGEPFRYGYAPGNPTVGSMIREVPQWLEENQPRPSPGRHAIMSFKFFSRYAPLRPSGMLGPVRLMTDGPRAAFRLDAGSEVTVRSAVQDPVACTALDIFGKDVRNVLSAECRLTDGDAQVLLALAGDPAFAGDPDVSSLAGRHEAFVMKVLPDGRLLLAGSDGHGVAYALMEFSRMIGVSPWEWWADCSPQPRKDFVLEADFKLFREPSVAYRGIFINDEDFAFVPWVTRTLEPTDIPGRIGPQTHAKIFELLLRLRANTFWPAMHGSSVPFFLTEGNREVARQYGIYIGTSHCEPMASNANGEWRVRGEGEYNFISNRERVLDFWRDRVSSVKDQEIIYTLGMRGIHDGPMSGADTPEAQKAALAEVLAAQRSMLSAEVNPDLTRIPQVFIPYKEVLDAYEAGLEVPEDVTLMWCDDNYGYIRHFPTEQERSRPGGNGVYYHVSYWGRPHDYLWLGTFSPALLYQQMGLAFDRGIRKMWILNVGDIKPEEYQIELFMDMAWDMDAVRKSGWQEHLRAFLTREFGPRLASGTLPVLLEHYRLAYIRKPEFMGATREEERDPSYRVVKDLPWSEAFVRERMAAYAALYDKAESLAEKAAPQRRTAFYHLVQYPVQAAARMNEKALQAQLARHGLADWAGADAAYDAIQELTARYNQGKWDGMMNAAPRSLPVFRRFPHETVDTPLRQDPRVFCAWDGSDTRGAVQPCEGLGYNGRAALLPCGETVDFRFRSAADPVLVSLRMVPTHPVSGTQLRLSLSVDGAQPVVFPYETYGRSEEWKDNVLNNQAVRDTVLHLSGKGIHTLALTALDEGVILDRILVCEAPEGR